MFIKNEQRKLPYRMVVFHEVVSTGSFTKAAENLGHTKSAVSTYITQLEDLVGLTLLHRSTRQLSLTPAGRQFASRSATVYETIQLATEEIAEFSEEPQGRFAITAANAFEELAIGIVAKLCEEYPKIKPELTFTDNRLDLIKENIDLAVTVGTLGDSLNNAIHIARLRSVLLVSPEYLDRMGGPSDRWREEYSLISLPWTLDLEFTYDGRQICLNTNSNMRVNTLPAAVGCAVKGLGALLAPLPFVADELKTGELVALLPDWPGINDDVHALHRFGQQLPFIYRRFVEALRGELGSN